jgi:hypothetical protein
MKYIFPFCFFACILIFSSCFSNRNTIKIKLNDIDSVIRIAIPTHNCGCNWQERKSKMFYPTILKKYGYAWQNIYVKNTDSVNFLTDSKNVYQELKKLDSRFGGYSRFFIEYKTLITKDSNDYKTIGTWYHFGSNCEGYISGISANELEKNTSLTKNRLKLCDK